MPKTITQKIILKNISAANLYNTYIDSNELSTAIGAAVKIQKKEGAKFNAHDNYVTGKNFQFVKDKLIVQSWRASDWNKSDPDSTFISFLSKMVKTGLLIWCMPIFPTGSLKALKRNGTITIGNPGKNILPSTRKTNLLLSRIKASVRHYQNHFKKSNQ